MCHPRWDETENTKPGEGQWKCGHCAAQNKLCKSRCIQFPNERCCWYRCWWIWWIWNTRRWTGPSGCKKRSSVGAHFCKLQEILWLSTYTSFNYFPLVNFNEHQNAQGWSSENLCWHRDKVFFQYREIFSETVLSNPRSWLFTETKRLRPDSKRFTLLNLLFPCNILSELFLLMKRMLQIWYFFCQTCHGWWCGICFLWFGYLWFFNKKSSNEKRSKIVPQ